MNKPGATVARKIFPIRQEEKKLEREQTLKKLIQVWMTVNGPLIKLCISGNGTEKSVLKKWI